jgi:hypothetical protein
MFMNVLRGAGAVATLALLSSIPAAGQAPKLSPQQLNQPTLNANKPIAAPVSPKPLSPNMNKPIAMARPTFHRPATDTKLRPMAHGSIASGTLTWTRDQRRWHDGVGGNPYPGPSPYAYTNSKTSRLTISPAVAAEQSKKGTTEINAVSALNVVSSYLPNSEDCRTGTLCQLIADQ